MEKSAGARERPSWGLDASTEANQMRKEDNVRVALPLRAGASAAVISEDGVNKPQTRHGYDGNDDIRENIHSQPLPSSDVPPTGMIL